MTIQLKLVLVVALLVTAYLGWQQWQVHEARVHADHLIEQYRTH